MAQTNPSDGWVDMPSEDGWEDMPAKPAEKPGVLRRALSWLHEPVPAIAARQQAAAEQPDSIASALGVPPLGKGSSDLSAGLATFAQGLKSPGDAPLPREAQERVGRFRSEHQVLGTVLPMAGAFMHPVPGMPKATPAAAAPAAAPVAGSALPNAVSAAAAGNPFEAAARAAKVQGLAKAIEANVTAHLGAETLNSPQFAEKLGSMPEAWWEGMANIAKTNKPSQTTIGEVANFFRDRAGQVAAAVSQEAAPIASAAAPSKFETALTSLGDKLSNMPRQPLDMMDLFTLTHKGLPYEMALRAARNYGPRLAGGALKTVAKAPGPVLIQSVNAAKALEGQ